MKETDIPEDFHVRKHGIRRWMNASNITHGIEKGAFRPLLTNPSKKLQGKAEAGNDLFVEN